MALVISKEAHANISSVAPSRALQMAGVVDYISAADVVGSNLFGPIERTEEILATEEVSDFLVFDFLLPACMGTASYESVRIAESYMQKASSSLKWADNAYAPGAQIISPESKLRFLQKPRVRVYFKH